MVVSEDSQAWSYVLRLLTSSNQRSIRE
nr:hypothetical protein [Tanacetum cinerariifolium]